jgi:hypothetical protein
LLPSVARLSVTAGCINSTVYIKI